MNSKVILSLGIHGGLYLLLVLGIWMIFAESITAFFKRAYYSRFRIEKKSWITSNKWFKYLNKLIAITCGQTNYVTVYSFIILTLSLPVLFFTLLVNRTSLAFACLVSTFFGILPYLYLRIKLSAIRIEGSYEADTVVGELLNQYKMNYSNMIEAVDSMVNLKEAPICRKAFYRLSLRLKGYKTNEELLEGLEEVVFTVDTDWMRMLTNNIYMSIDRGIDVIIGLEDILLELKEAKSTTEKSKQINIEGFSILKYLSPAMYIATVLIAVKYFGFTLSKFIKYQLYTSIGIKFFVLILLLIMINMIIMLVFQKRKYDF